MKLLYILVLGGLSFFIAHVSASKEDKAKAVMDAIPPLITNMEARKFVLHIPLSILRMVGMENVKPSGNAPKSPGKPETSATAESLKSAAQAPAVNPEVEMITPQKGGPEKSGALREHPDPNKDLPKCLADKKALEEKNEKLQEKLEKAKKKLDKLAKIIKAMVDRFRKDEINDNKKLAKCRKKRKMYYKAGKALAKRNKKFRKSVRKLKKQIKELNKKTRNRRSISEDISALRQTSISAPNERISSLGESFRNENDPLVPFVLTNFGTLTPDKEVTENKRGAKVSFRMPFKNTQQYESQKMEPRGKLPFDVVVNGTMMIRTNQVTKSNPIIHAQGVMVDIAKENIVFKEGVTLSEAQKDMVHKAVQTFFSKDLYQELLLDKMKIAVQEKSVADKLLN